MGEPAPAEPRPVPCGPEPETELEGRPTTLETDAAGWAVAKVTPVGISERQPTMLDTDAAVWTTVLARLQSQMTTANYQTWLADTRPLGRRGTTLVVGAPSSFVREWLQTRFRALVRRALQEIAPELSDVAFAVAPGGEGAGAPSPD